VTTRRDILLRGAALGAAVTVGGPAAFSALIDRLAHAEGSPFRGGTRTSVLPFERESRLAVGKLISSGLDGRRALDLSRIDGSSLVTSTADFYVRTRYPGRRRRSNRIVIAGHVSKNASVWPGQLRRSARSMGVHVMECAGNMSNRAFGLISSARWKGVPLGELLKRAKPTAAASQLKVVGFDRHAARSRSSTAGADWVFKLSDLTRAGAFLATHMNGRLLTRDHGAPVRLIVPGWYGCTAIKWVERLELLDNRAPTTAHMAEYSTRVHQYPSPKLAKDFIPAVIDLAAMPIRVETWRVSGVTRYRVVGLMWGGHQRTDKLEIQFGSRYHTAVDSYGHKTNATWTLWSHEWLKPHKGLRRIRLRVNDTKIRTRRLDSGHYARYVRVR